MCFRFDACFGAPDKDDCHGGLSANKGLPSHGGHHAAKTTTAPPHYARPAPAQQRNGGHDYYGYQLQGVAHHGNGYRAPPHHHQAHAPATTMGGHHGYAAGAAYVYSGAQDMVMLAARNATVVAGNDEGRHGAHSDRENAAAADHHYSTTATTASIYG